MKIAKGSALFAAGEITQEYVDEAIAFCRKHKLTSCQVKIIKDTELNMVLVKAKTEFNF